jgi:uncharacterized repeat protein (TIGR01451 family)
VNSNPAKEEALTRQTTTLITLLVLLLWAPPAQAQAPAGSEKRAAPKLELQVSVLNLTLPGKQELAPKRVSKPAGARPGDRLAYALLCRNVGAEQAREAEVTDRIPFGTVYEAGSATSEGARVTFSLDGAKTFKREPLTYETTDATGKKVKKPVPPSMITHLRWTFEEPLAPSAERLVRFNVRVK